MRSIQRGIHATVDAMMAGEVNANEADAVLAYLRATNAFAKAARELEYRTSKLGAIWPDERGVK